MAEDGTDWAAIDAMTDEDIARQIESNPDAPPDLEVLGPPTDVWVTHPGVVDVRALRARLGLTQSTFAARLGVPVGTLRGWEQGRHRPTGAAAALLRLIDRLGPGAVNLLEPAPRQRRGVANG